ncbi:MAG: hypothetical protein NTX61_08770 [Bacteroidetes bacterium]|nr:hypothetical protein [Bacteroidota bacterium]
MINTIVLRKHGTIASLLFDVPALAFLYFVPALSHLFAAPIYLLEPMRIVLILAIAHTQRNNAYIIALTLPLFSFIISSHPEIYKSLLIAAELLLNVILFFQLSKNFRNRFAVMLSSILISKIFYYMLKYFMINFGCIHSSLVTTPLLLQGITTLLFSVYIFFILPENRGEKEFH